LADVPGDAAVAAQLVDHAHHVIERVRVEATDALVDEQGVELGAADPGDLDVGQAEVPLGEALVADVVLPRPVVEPVGQEPSGLAPALEPDQGEGSVSTQKTRLTAR
jgi:hypothetical protein